MIRLVPYGRCWLASQLAGLTPWMVFGRITPWDDENNPPLPSTETSVTEPQFAKKISQIRQVYPGTSGDYDIELEGTYWKIAITDNDIYANNARYVYVKFVADRGAGPAITVRQFGIIKDIVAITGHTSDTLLLDAYVSSYGRLLYLDNRKKITRDPTNVGEIFEYNLGF
jgi:hypothetical protein